MRKRNAVALLIPEKPIFKRGQDVTRSGRFTLPDFFKVKLSEKTKFQKTKIIVFVQS